MSGAEKIATHEFPVWRDKADFIIASRLDADLGIEDLLAWEQLWARKVSSSSFELCCIPFFTYGLALGDVVETSNLETRDYVVSKVINPSGRKTFRVFFQSIIRWNEIVDEITSRGFTVEPRWQGSKLIAIDADVGTDCGLLTNYLKELENANEINWENGN
jgi:hypothetical protein